MATAAAVMTAPRKVNYLDATLASVRAAGFDPIIVRDTRQEGPNSTFRGALSFLLGTTPADRLVVFQDDIQVARGLAEWIEGDSMLASMGNDGVASLYRAAVSRVSAVGWTMMPLLATPADPKPWTRIYGALATVWPRDVAQQFLNDPPAIHGKTLLEQLIGKWLSLNGKTLFVHSPSLVQHVGAVSTLVSDSTNEVRNRLLKEYREAGDFVDDVAKLQCRT